jgi:hypothetical protein
MPKQEAHNAITWAITAISVRMAARPLPASHPEYFSVLVNPRTDAYLAVSTHGLALLAQALTRRYDMGQRLMISAAKRGCWA